MSVKNKVQLITYADSLGGDLKKLRQVLNTYFKGSFQGGVHILPPFPSSGDRGFSPVTYFQIEPSFGDWEDIQALAADQDVLLDLMVNHMSSNSMFFQDFLKNGSKSEYADMFLSIKKIWPDGNPKNEDLEKIFLRRTVPFSDFSVGNGEKQTLWTTFGNGNPSDQVDLDVNSPVTRALYTKIIEHFHANHVRIVRLDAVGYVIKKPGTSCFFVEPEIFQFMNWIRDLAAKNGIELLPEVHAELATQRELIEHGYWIYDFILPYLILETLIKKRSTKLKDYLKVRPSHQFTMLDCHDGIPVKPDLNGYYNSADVNDLVNLCTQRGAGFSRVISKEHKDPNGFDVHQICGTYYSMLGADDDAYFAARSIQLFTPGIPQIYYVGLLAGENDIVAAEQSGEMREINRHSYTLEEIDREVERPIVKRLLRLIEFRNTYPAFDGQCVFDDCSDKELSITWKKDHLQTRLHIDLTQNEVKILFVDENSGKQVSLD
jgi:sucrose 6(F)-phosphate phosphorylase